MARPKWALLRPRARRYAGHVRASWRRYAARVMRAVEDMIADGEVERHHVAALLLALRQIAGGEYVTPTSLARAASAAAAASESEAIRSLRRAGMPRRVESELFVLPPGSSGTVGLGELTVQTQAVLGEWGREGSVLIRGAQQAVVERIAEGAAEIVATGGRWESLRDLVRESIDATEPRVRLIARDQVSKLNSQITERFHRRAGVAAYTWRASMDERTREVHQAADGEILQWDSDGWPGAGFYGQPAHAGRGGQCRCTAEPIAPAWWAQT